VNGLFEYLDRFVSLLAHLILFGIVAIVLILLLLGLL